jgi:hypothetical protein
MLLVTKQAGGVDISELSMPVFSLPIPEDQVVETSQIEVRAKTFRLPKSDTISADGL